MQESHDAQSIIEAARQAAAANDYISAEALLRRAVVAQETALGPLHPDLASTVNNLGIVCEINDKPVDAEACFRRAFTIATHAFGPDDPMVATSRQNLRDFCDARGKPFELPPPPSVATKAPLSPAAHQDAAKERIGRSGHDRVTPTPRPRPVSRPAQPAERRRSVRSMVMGALGPVVMLIAIVAARPWLGSTEGRASAPEPANERAPETPPVPSTPGPTSGVADKTTTIDPPSPDTPSDQRTAATIPVQATVVKAQLCAALEDWHCDPPDRPIPAGQLFFYTQVKSASSIGIQHRWYQGSRLQHVVDLRVDGSTSGYRSFSRYTMGDGNAGNWRVELRTEDGVLLQEERFLVQ